MKNQKHINRRTFLEKCMAGSGAAFLTNKLALNNTFSSPKKLNSHSSRQRNVLLLISDDHGIDQLGCYGNQNIKTPYLDQMAAEGVNLRPAAEKAYAVRKMQWIRRN